MTDDPFRCRQAAAACCGENLRRTIAATGKSADELSYGHVYQ
jgi:hypothetical protein